MIQAFCNPVAFGNFVILPLGMKWLSRIALIMAAFVMLLISAVPHHHHCSNLETTHHIDYICFADDDFDCADQDEDAAHCFEADSECSHRHNESPCRLHLIVTLLAQMQSVPQFQASLLALPVEPDASVSPAMLDYSSEHFVPLSERLLSYYLVKSKGLRAPPARV